MLHLAQHRVGPETRGDVRRHQRFYITGVGRKSIVAPRAEISIVENRSPARTDLHQRSCDRLQMNVAADRRKLHVTVANVDQRDRPRIVLTCTWQFSTLRTLTAASAPSMVKSPCKRSADNGPVEECRLTVASGGISSS